MDQVPSRRPGQLFEKRIGEHLLPSRIGTGAAQPLPQEG